jgi:gas vesicle protein
MKEHEPLENRGFGTGHILLALLGGAAAGAAAAYFMSPRSGPDNRRRVREIAHETRESVGQEPLALKMATRAASAAFSEAIAADNYNKR